MPLTALEKACPTDAWAVVYPKVLTMPPQKKQLDIMIFIRLRTLKKNIKQNQTYGNIWDIVDDWWFFLVKIFGEAPAPVPFFATATAGFFCWVCWEMGMGQNPPFVNIK